MFDLYSAFARSSGSRDAKAMGKNALVYAAEQAGSAWYVVSGVVRLDRSLDDGPHFSGLALSGDVIGIEATLHGCYADSAIALTPCVLVPWHPAEAGSGQPLLEQLAAQQRRLAEVLNLRCGQVEERMHRLFALLHAREAHASTVHLPSLRHIAEMLDITPESASRVLSRWRQQGWLGARRKGLAEFHLPDIHGEKAAA